MTARWCRTDSVRPPMLNVRLASDRWCGMDIEKFERVEVRSEAQLWDWLRENHSQAESVWLVTWKAAHRDRYVSRDAVLDALTAHGWIDGRRLKLDAERTMQLISRRRQQVWAGSYKARAARLREEGRMHPAGLAALRDGQAGDLWHVSEPIDQLKEPADLGKALDAIGAADWWRSAAPSYRRNVLRWIASAKRPETRARRIEIVVARSAKRERVPQY
jgi:uncharacterized protein YdeI (YjbR/CyaY-like superfamily)